jgi:hypothetical protein
MHTRTQQINSSSCFAHTSSTTIHLLSPFQPSFHSNQQQQQQQRRRRRHQRSPPVKSTTFNSLLLSRRHRPNNRNATPTQRRQHHTPARTQTSWPRHDCLIRDASAHPHSPFHSRHSTLHQQTRASKQPAIRSHTLTLEPVLFIFLESKRCPSSINKQPTHPRTDGSAGQPTIHSTNKTAVPITTSVTNASLQSINIQAISTHNTSRSASLQTIKPSTKHDPTRPSA